jgi:hypothetical protein
MAQYGTINAVATGFLNKRSLAECISTFQVNRLTCLMH